MLPAWNLGTGEIETGNSGNRGLPQLHKEFKDNLVFVRPPHMKK